MSCEAELAALLLRRGPDGQLLYAERDVVACFAMLAKANPGSRGPAAQRYLDRLALYANIKAEDPNDVRVAKLSAYFEAYPIPDALVRAVEHALGGAVQLRAPADCGRFLGVDTPKTCVSGPRAGALHFLLDERTKRSPR